MPEASTAALTRSAPSTGSRDPARKSSQQKKGPGKKAGKKGLARKATSKAHSRAAPATTTATERSASSKTGAQKVTANKVTANKAAPKTSAPKKTAPKKAAANKTTANKTAPKKTAPKKTALKNTAPKKSVAKESAPKKSAPKKSVAKKTAPKKAAATKTAANKTAPKKTAPKKTAPTTGGARRVRLPVRAGEDPWTKAEVAEVRADLEVDRGRLLGEVANAERGIQVLLRDGGDGAGNDQADVGSNALERDAEMSLANNSREMLFQVERALSRLEDGSYGVCEACGEPIGKLRLMAFPRATLCVSCKQRQERR